MTAPTNDPERIRELLLDNLFAVFNVRDPERRMEAIAATTQRTSPGRTRTRPLTDTKS